MTLVARSWLLVTVLALSGSSTTGCSYLLVQGPPANFREMNPRRLDCTTSSSAPVVDVAASALYGLGLATTLAAVVPMMSSSSYSGAILVASSPLLLAEAGMLTLHMNSASHGFKATKECMQAQAILATQHGEFSPWSSSGLATPTLTPPPPYVPSIPLGCTNTPEFRKASAREKKAIIDECKRRAAEAAALDTHTPIPATPSEPPPPPPF